MRAIAGAAAAAIWCMTGAPLPAGELRPLAMEGITLNGGEFGGNLRETPWLGGARLGFDYIYPRSEEIDYFVGKGMTIVRIPFKARHLMGPTREAAFAILEGLVKHAAARGASIILDMHDYGYTQSGKLIGRDAGSVEEFTAQWSAIAARFKNFGNVVFGLMCEPHKQTATEWIAGANAGILAIRNQGANQLILVPGSYWDGGLNWTTTDNASVIGSALRDPVQNYAIEIHQYLDDDNSGSHSSVVAGSGATALAAVTDWARANGQKLFLGEFGFAADTESMTEGRALVDYIHQHADIWKGSTYWGAGPWWGKYMFSVEPAGLGTSDPVDKPQMEVLQTYLRPRARRP